MPNWCHNRYAIQGKMSSLIQFKNWVDGLVPTPRYHLAVEHSKKFFILGATGHFLATRFPAKPSVFDVLTPREIGGQTMENQAYTDWLEMLGTEGFTLTEENSRRISNLFYSAGGHFVTWDDLTLEQQQMAEAIMFQQSYDWYGSWHATLDTEKAFNSEPDIPEMGLPGDLYSVMPPQLTPLLNGYNGGLIAGRRVDFTSPNAYNMNAWRYGTKWPTFTDGVFEIHNETQASMDVDTAWSPPSAEVDASLVEKFGLEFLNHRYIEEGCGFAGYRDVENVVGVAEVIEDVEDCLEMDWSEEDKLKYKDDEDLMMNCNQHVVSPDYVKDIYDSTKKLSGLIGAMAIKELEKKE